ncbi:MAG: ABC transporter substrate-binding protein [Bacillota bacterium]
MLKSKSSVILLVIFLTFALSMYVLGSSEKQAPELQEQVEMGDLEPLEERLPEEPLTLQNEIGEIGQYGGTLTRYGNTEEFDHIRKFLYGFSFLRWVDDGLDIESNLVKEWERNEDATEWTLYFRKGIKWSDGEPMTVDDVLFWWEDMALDDECSDVVPDYFVSGGENVEMEKIDEYTLKLKYAAPAPLLPERLAMWANSSSGNRLIVPKHYLKQFHPEYSENGSYEDLEDHAEWWIETETPVLTAWMPVEYEPGNRIVFERNPYFYATDKEGNQLPYIDKIEVMYQSDSEVLKLNLINGKSDFQYEPRILTVEDVSILDEKSSEEGYEIFMWDSGTGSYPVLFPNRNHPDEEKQKLYKNPKFLRAVSHAINRDRINKMVYYEQAEPTTGTFSPKASEYQTNKGEKIYEEWRDLAVEFNPEKSKELLDEIGVVDENNDGWREMPEGEELSLRIDLNTEAEESFFHTHELIKEDWEEVGIKIIINTVDGSELSVMQEQAEFDVYGSMGLGDGPNHLVFPQWLVPIDQFRWAPLYGNYYRTKGTSEEELDVDKDPRERNPMWDEPEEDGFVDTLQKLYDEARFLPTEEERNEKVYEMINQHIENGPVFWGTVSNPPFIGVVNEKLKNVPRREDLALGGFAGPHIMVYPAITLPPTYYFED